MRVARQGSDGTWYLVEKTGDMSRIAPLDWTADRQGHWPLVELRVREIGAEIACPACATAWTMEEMDCIFGDARRNGNDITLLVRCLNCRLPQRVLLAGGVTAYPQMVERMAGWADWERRDQRVREQEQRWYGAPLSGTSSEIAGG